MTNERKLQRAEHFPWVLIDEQGREFARVETGYFTYRTGLTTDPPSEFTREEVNAHAERILALWNGLAEIASPAEWMQKIECLVATADEAIGYLRDADLDEVADALLVDIAAVRAAKGEVRS